MKNKQVEINRKITRVLNLIASGIGLFVFLEILLVFLIGVGMSERSSGHKSIILSLVPLGLLIGYGCLFLLPFLTALLSLRPTSKKRSFFAGLSLVFNILFIIVDGIFITTATTTMMIQYLTLLIIAVFNIFYLFTSSSKKIATDQLS